MKISLLLIISILCYPIQSTHAKLSMLSTMDVMEEVSIATEREKIVAFLVKEEVKNELTKNGVDHSEAVRRVANLSHLEVKNLSLQIENSKAGGDFGLGGVLGAAVFIFLVLLVTDILGFTKVYHFTK
jgi:hypothetical protein